MYGALVAGYAFAIIVLLASTTRSDRLWPRVRHEGGLPLKVVVPVIVAVVMIGLIAQRGLLIPTSGEWRWLTGSLNQLIIWSPVFAVAGHAMARSGEESRAKVMLPRDQVPVRLALGVVAGICALVAHQAVAGRLDAFMSSVTQIASPSNIPYGIQILGEDLGIAMLLASLLRIIKPRTAVIVTGLLFALGHVPAMVTGGATGSEFVRLISDGLLAAGVVAVLLRLRDVWVLWPVHVAMDLTQFLR